MSSQISKRVQMHRERLRASGLLPVQIWVPDIRKEGFAEECRRQSRLVTDDPQEVEILEWIEKVSDTRGWE